MHSLTFLKFGEKNENVKHVFILTHSVKWRKNLENIGIDYVTKYYKNSCVDLEFEKLPKDIIIVPKIESPNAVDNIKEIFESLRNNKKIIMLDHDDLFSSILKQNIDKNQFEVYIQRLGEFCEKNNVLLLRTVGVMFSDDEKRITQYEK